MSNYLNNLAARQLDRASLVQPRLPSLFEPTVYPNALLQNWQSDAAEPFNVETREVESEIDAPPVTGSVDETRAHAPAPRSHTPAPPSHTPAPRAPASNDETAGTVWRGLQQMTASSKPPAGSTLDATGEDSSPIAGTHLRASRTTPTPTPEQAAAASLTPPSSDAPEETASPRQHARELAPRPAAAVEQTDEAREHNVSPRPKTSRIDAARVEATKHDVESTEGGVEASKHGVASARKGVEATKNSLVVQPRIVALVENRRERDASPPPLELPAPEQQPPVINVTIGRIEVRASTAASAHAPRRSEASAKPLLSLDEYLRRRTNGGGA